MIDPEKVSHTINCLEIADKQFLYAKVQTGGGEINSATFLGGQDFNNMNWQPIQSS